MARIFHAHLYGDRKTKYNCLTQSDISETAWLELEPQKPFYLLIPQNTEFLIEYEEGWKITDIMPINSTGVKTHRDRFVMDFDESSLRERISQFRDLSIDHKTLADRFDLKDTRDWKISSRRSSLSSNKQWEQFFTTCQYRPFDSRHYYHHADVVELPRQDVMQHLLSNNNLGLIARRQMAGELITYFFVSEQIISDGLMGADNKGRESLFPLYLYSEAEIEGIESSRRFNLSQPFLNDITDRLGYTPNPEAIFYYIYAVFHSPTYRSRYAEFLKIDFPRIPLTRNDALFRQLTIYGEQLVALHLMKSPKLDRPITEFMDQGGSEIVDPGHPKYNNGSVIINKKGDRFVNVPEPVWNFYVGGYQVCAKWLKDRKGRTLTPEDILHYQRIVVALQETIHLMQQIDEAIPAFPIA